MTLQQAVKTGRPFRRPDKMWWSHWNAKGYLCEAGTEKTVSIRVESVLANDWIVMTKEEFADFQAKGAERWFQNVISDKKDRSA